MDAWTYGIYLLVFTFDISLVRCSYSFDIECEHSKINSISPHDHLLFSISFIDDDDDDDNNDDDNHDVDNEQQ